MFTTEEQSRVLGKLEWNESLASPRPPLGAQSGAGRGPGERSSLRQALGGRRRWPRGILLNRPLFRLHPRFFCRETWGNRWVLCLFFVLFPCDLSNSPAPTRAALQTSPPPTPHLGPGGGVRAAAALPTPPSPEPTCPHPRAEPLRFPLAGGQASSPPAASWVHSILDLKG